MKFKTHYVVKVRNFQPRCKVSPVKYQRNSVPLPTPGPTSTGLWDFGSLGKSPDHCMKHDLQNGMWESRRRRGGGHWEGLLSKGALLGSATLQSMSLLLYCSYKEGNSVFGFVTSDTKTRILVKMIKPVEVARTMSCSETWRQVALLSQFQCLSFFSFSLLPSFFISPLILYYLFIII
jgi:hypothetical protein